MKRANLQNICQLLILYAFILGIDNKISGYGLPAINLGLSSFLDGGPLRQIPGWYFQNPNQYYTTHRFLDGNGKLLFDVPSPRYTLLASTFQFIYLSQKDFLGVGNIGFDITLPVALYSRIRRNELSFTSSGSGVGDLAVGVYAQALPKRWRNFTYVHRFELVLSMPSGKSGPAGTITPGWCTSWRLHYLWVSANHNTHVKAGDAIHLNYSMEYEIKSRLWVGINAYFLQQIKDNRLAGVVVPNSRERVFAIGPGILYSLAPRYAFVLFGDLYFEMDVRNRPQGVKAVFRVLKHF